MDITNDYIKFIQGDNLFLARQHSIYCDFISDEMYILIDDNNILLVKLVLYEPCIIQIYMRFNIHNRAEYTCYNPILPKQFDNINELKLLYPYVVGKPYNILTSYYEVIEIGAGAVNNEPKQNNVEKIDDKTNYKDNVTCLICTENKINICFVPCGHTICSNCSEQIDKCHICKGEINKKMKIFI